MGPGQRSFGSRNRRRRPAENWVVTKRRFHAKHRIRVNFVNGRLVGSILHDAVGQERRDDVTIARGEGLLHPPRAGIGGDDGMGGMRRAHGRREELRS